MSHHCKATMHPSLFNSQVLILLNGLWSASMCCPLYDLQSQSFSFSFQNYFHLKIECVQFDTLTHSIYMWSLVMFSLCWLLSLLISSLICFFSLSLSRSLLMGTLCFGVLGHLMWSNQKRTEPGIDASLLQTDTSSKSRKSANHAEVSSFWPEFKRQDFFSHLKLIGCLAWQCYK